MSDSKKLLFGITFSTFLVMSTVVIMTNNAVNSNSINSGIRHSYATIPANVNYAGYHKATTKSTLIKGTNLVIVKDEGSGVYRASTTTIDGNNQLTTKQVYITDDAFTTSVTPFTYDTYKPADVEYSCFMAGDKQLQCGGNESNLALGNSIMPMTLEFNGEGMIRTGFLNNTRRIGYNSTYHVFVQGNYSENYSFALYVNVDSAVTAWATKYLHMDLNVNNQCTTYFGPARTALLAMDDYVKADLYYNTGNETIKSYKDRYEAWAAHLGEDPYNE